MGFCNQVRGSRALGFRGEIIERQDADVRRNWSETEFDIAFAFIHSDVLARLKISGERTQRGTVSWACVHHEHAKSVCRLATELCYFAGEPHAEGIDWYEA